MSFDQKLYINGYNKDNYKMYQFRVKRNDKELIDFLDGLENKNSYILSLLKHGKNKDIYTLKQIRLIIIPILKKYGITNVSLFGSYARGEANENSDIDIYCDKGNIKTYIDQINLEEELETALNKKVDIVFNTTKINDYFREQIMEDMIRLC